MTNQIPIEMAIKALEAQEQHDKTVWRPNADKDKAQSAKGCKRLRKKALEALRSIKPVGNAQALEAWRNVWRAVDYYNEGNDDDADKFYMNESMEALYNALTSKGVDEWQPMATAPKDGTEILTYENGYIIKNNFIHIKGTKKHPEMKTWNVHSIHPHTQPTHWMPLPQPPESKNNDTE